MRRLLFILFVFISSSAAAQSPHETDISQSTTNQCIYVMQNLFGNELIKSQSNFDAVFPGSRSAAKDYNSAMLASIGDSNNQWHGWGFRERANQKLPSLLSTYVNSEIEDFVKIPDNLFNAFALLNLKENNLPKARQCSQIIKVDSSEIDKVDRKIDSALIANLNDFADFFSKIKTKKYLPNPRYYFIEDDFTKDKNYIRLIDGNNELLKNISQSPFAEDYHLAKAHIELASAQLDGSFFTERAKKHDNTPFECLLADSGPYVIKPFNIERAYPVEALKKNITGKIKAILDIDEDGNVTNVTIEASEPQGVFEQSVMDEAKNIKYSPKIKDCIPHKSSTPFIIRFDMW